MTPRELALRSVLLLAALVASVLLLVLVVLRDLGIEIADEVRASRNETRNRSRGGNMPLPKNRRIRDYHSTITLRAFNAELAARQQDDRRFRRDIGLALDCADMAAFPIRRSA